MDIAPKSETKYLVWQPWRSYGSYLPLTKNLPFNSQHKISCQPPATSLWGSVTVSEVAPLSPAAPSLGLGMVWESGLGQFCPLLDSSIRHSVLKLSIWSAGAWKGLRHGSRFSLPNFASYILSFQGYPICILSESFPYPFLLPSPFSFTGMNTH